MLYHSLRYCHQYKIDDDGRDEAGDGIDKIMRLNIYGSQTQEDVEWQHGKEQLAVSAVPGKEYADGAYAHVRTRVGGGRSLSCFLGILYELVEDSVGIAWGRQTVGMGAEVIAHCREDALAISCTPTASK